MDLIKLYKYLYYIFGCVSLVFAFNYFSNQTGIIYVFISFVLCLVARMMHYRTAVKKMEEKEQDKWYR